MGERRPPSATAPFDRAELARLKEKTAEANPIERERATHQNVVPSRRVPLTPAEGGSPRSRSATLADPMTTSILAHGAGSERTDSAPPIAPDDDDEPEIEIVEHDTPHPHVKRR